MRSREQRRQARKGDVRPETAIEKRRETHPWLYAFSVALLVVIVVTFLGSPIASRLAGESQIVFGTYEGEDIAYAAGNYLARQKDIIAQQVREQSGEDTSIEAQAYTVWRRAFEETVRHTAILLATERSGVWISENKLDDTIIQFGPYMEDGEFSEERYRNTSNLERVATRKYFREQILHGQYLQDQIASQRQSQSETDFVESMMSPERSFHFASLSFSDFPQEEVLEFANTNTELFKRIKLSRILVKSSQNEALEIRKKLLQQISSFEELAKAHSKDTYAEKGGDMGWRYYYDLEGDFHSSESLQAVFALKEGELSDVIEGSFGWMIFRCDAEAIAPQFADQETLDQVRDYMMRYERGRVEDYFWTTAEGFQTSAQEKGFFQACEAMKIMPHETPRFPINYLGVFFTKPVRSTTDEPNLSSASYNQDFFEQAFALGEDEISDPIILDDQIIVLKLKEERPAPEDESNLRKSYYQALVAQSIENDLQAELMDSDKLVDNFTEVFYRYFIPR